MTPTPSPDVEKALEARVWTIRFGDDRPRIVDGPIVPSDGFLRVIELDPVLDLLARWFNPTPSPDPDSLLMDTQRLLRAHGRLPDREEE